MPMTLGVATTTAPTVSTDWRQGLPLLKARGVTLRELRLSDAASLLALLTTATAVAALWAAARALIRNETVVA